MLSNHRVLRAAAFTTVCALLSLVTAGTGAAYPITPEGEPLHVEAGSTPTLPATAEATSDVGPADRTASIPPNVVAVEEISSEDDTWVDTGLMAIAALAVLALALAALRLGGSGQGSARGDVRRERS